MASTAAFVQPTAATAEPSPQACSAGFCAYPGANFSGNGIPVYGDGCQTFAFTGTRRSYTNDSNIEGYFYSDFNCTGQSRPVTHGSSEDDLGFAAGSFGSACVSCRSEGP
ncbi:peptidase inhibitor family I36 protein [Pseudonocardia sp. TRM90224]|uniref:peptidase inhibitor family I36 protein n=1 Tax=Pseudonocardia sp. TRM90224 TaxID=2812678 RepID=UPI0035A84D89